MRRLQEELDRRGISQATIAGRLEWSQSRVSKLLHGKLDVTVDDLAALCFAVNLPLTEAVRDHGLEFCAEMTPTELLTLHQMREMPKEDRDTFLRVMEIKGRWRNEARGATPRKPIIPRGRSR
jgi:transcriptional regulator with XRE-family HTH domain